MALKLVRRPWGRQPIGAAGINWGHPRAEGLAFFAPLSGAHGTRDLVQEQLGVRTGLEEYVPAQNGAIYHRFFSANRADFPLLPLGIGLNTPFTLAWTQEPRSGSAYSALLVVNFGTAGTDHQFTIYQSTSDASYSMVTGPLGAGSSASNTPRFSGIGVATNERLDRFVLQCSGGSQSVTTGDYVLWRNGERFTTSATAVISAYRTAAFRIGALSDAGDPFEGLIGDMRMWSRVLSDGEAEEESTVHGSWALFEPQRIWVPVSTVGGGDVTVSLSGSQSSSGAGSLGPASSVGVSGSSVSSSAGSITAALSVSVSGASAASAAGTLAPSLSVALSGASASASAGTVSTGNDVAVSLSGQQATTAAGSLGVAVQVALSGASTAAAAGAVVPGISLSLSGSAATAYAGTITPSVNNDVVVGLSGSESIADAGIVVASGGTAATRSAGFEMVGHKPSRRLWWMRKPKNLTEEEAEEALEDVAEAIVDKVAEQVAKKAPADKVKKAVKEAVKPVAEKMPGFDWAAFYKQAFEAAQQAQQEQERTQAAIRNYIVKAMADAQRRRIEQDDEDIELLAMML